MSSVENCTQSALSVTIKHVNSKRWTATCRPRQKLVRKREVSALLMNGDIVNVFFDLKTLQMVDRPFVIERMWVRSPAESYQRL